MWGINQQKVNAMIEKIRTSATTASISGTFSGNWILNNDGNNPRTPLPTGGTKYPDGKVWVVSGDLTFDNDVSFSGRGTIIVNGNLNIQRSVRYLNEQTDFVGIIADNITIGKDSNGIVGAYYTNGTIEMLAK